MVTQTLPRKVIENLIIMQVLIFLNILLWGGVCRGADYSQEISESGYIGLKVDYIHFTDSILEDNDIEKGDYLALETNGMILPNLYLGGEIGVTIIDGSYKDIDTELTFVPVEIHVRYRFDLSSRFNLDVGVGVAHCFYDIEIAAETNKDGDDSDKNSVWGAQASVDLNTQFGWFYIGANAKYQITEDIVDDINLNSYRVGAQFGIAF
jgi:hypothetical protein